MGAWHKRSYTCAPQVFCDTRGMKFPSWLILSVSVVLPAFGDGFKFEKYAKKDAVWYLSAEGSNVVANVLSQQSAQGTWPKNIDTAAKPAKQAADKIAGTFDNGATTGELRLLADAFAATGDSRCRVAVERGIDAILQAQYPTGGWPQYYPPPAKSYHRHITFNDDAMVRLLLFLRELIDTPRFQFVDAARREAARSAVARGIACIVRCQVNVAGKLTAWCAQHDEVTLEPRPARAFELASLSGGESAGLLVFLMSLETPSADVVKAVHAGAAWYEAAQLKGIRVVTEGGDRKVVSDPAAPPIWARFYDLESGRPFFCDRDGVKKWSLAEIGHERRNGYAWYGNWGEKVAQRYAEWKKDHPLPAEAGTTSL